jgi:ABC-2 type transport system permease protein
MFYSDKVVYVTSWKSTLVYRFGMFFSVVTGPLLLFANYLIWKSIFSMSQSSIIGGYSLNEMLTHIVVAQVTFFLLWDNVHDNLSEAVRTGSLTSFLLKPIEYWRFQFWTKLGHRSMAFFIEFIPVALVTGFLVGFSVFKTNTLSYYFVVVFIASTIMFLINFLLGMISFWFVKAKGFLTLYKSIQWLLEGGILPLSLCPSFVQKIFLFLPFQFIGFVPARVFLGSYELAGVMLSPLQVILYGLVNVIVLFIIVKIAWHISVRRYCGAGQ